MTPTKSSSGPEKVPLGVTTRFPPPGETREPKTPSQACWPSWFCGRCQRVGGETRTTAVACGTRITPEPQRESHRWWTPRDRRSHGDRGWFVDGDEGQGLRH